MLLGFDVHPLDSHMPILDVCNFHGSSNIVVPRISVSGTVAHTAAVGCTVEMGVGIAVAAYVLAAAELCYCMFFYHLFHHGLCHGRLVLLLGPLLGRRLFRLGCSIGVGTEGGA